MRQKTILFSLTAAVFAFASCVSPMRPNSFPIEQQVAEGKIKFKGGGGKSLEDAVLVKGAVDEHEALLAEMYYLSREYGAKDDDWILGSMATIQRGRRIFDDVELTLKKNSMKIHIYFDISDNHDFQDRYFN
jgi:hypothetical protein